MVTKLGRKVTCHGGAPSSKLRDLLIMESRDTRKKIIFTFPQYLWLQTCQSGNLQLEDPSH